MADQTPRRLSDEEARRLLSRAVELDVRAADTWSLAELREAALEAGVALDAFEQAVDESALCDEHSQLRVAPVPRTLRQRIVCNLVPFAAVALSTGLILLPALQFVSGRLSILLDALPFGIGFAVAHQLRARAARVVMIGLGAAVLADSVVHIVAGYPVIGSGFPADHWALPLAGLLAAASVAITTRLHRSTRQAAESFGRSSGSVRARLISMLKRLWPLHLRSLRTVPRAA